MRSSRHLHELVPPTPFPLPSQSAVESVGNLIGRTMPKLASLSPWLPVVIRYTQAVVREERNHMHRLCPRGVPLRFAKLLLLRRGAGVCGAGSAAIYVPRRLRHFQARSSHVRLRSITLSSEACRNTFLLRDLDCVKDVLLWSSTQPDVDLFL